MFKEIRWTLFITAKTRVKADRILDNVKETLDKDFEILKCESYWKDKSLFRVEAVTSLNKSDINDALFETLRICRNLALRWVITGPSQREVDKWEFHGSIDHLTGSHIVGVYMADFLVDNYDIEVSNPEVVREDRNKQDMGGNELEMNGAWKQD